MENNKNFSHDEVVLVNVFIEALRRFARHPEAIDNYESYLTTHGLTNIFNKYMSTPDGLASELDQFSKIHD